ncbi:MAG: agmatine deiminase family protein [Pseudomonadota bacterium]
MKAAYARHTRRRFLYNAIAVGMGTPFLAASTVEATSSVDRPLYVPPEEAPHELTFMQWPVNRTVHPDGDFLDHLQQTIAAIANAISSYEPVVMLADRHHHPAAHRLLSNRVTLWDIPTDDLWCRDSGPLFAVHRGGELVVSHIQFNGWGDKQVHTQDARIAERAAQRLNLPLMLARLVGEAGGVEHDGHGLLLAHESSWVNQNRNPGLQKNEIEDRLLATYGAKRMIWSRGVYGQHITDYHIDSLARFTGRNRVLMNLPSRVLADDPFHQAALATRNRLFLRALKWTLFMSRA